MKVRKLTTMALLTAVALTIFVLEAQIPLPIPIPGIKLGLPNIAIIFVLYRFGLRDAAAVSLVRMIIVALLFGNPMTFAYSLAGAVLSLAIMAILKRLDVLSTVGVSVAGGVFHNVGQILMAMLLLGTAELGYYLIVLAVTGTVAGIVIGLAAGVAINRVPRLKM